MIVVRIQNVKWIGYVSHMRTTGQRTRWRAVLAFGSFFSVHLAQYYVNIKFCKMCTSLKFFPSVWVLSPTSGSPAGWVLEATTAYTRSFSRGALMFPDLLRETAFAPLFRFLGPRRRFHWALTSPHFFTMFAFHMVLIASSVNPL